MKQNRWSKWRQEEAKFAYLAILPALVILLSVFIYPWLKGVYYSLTDFQFINPLYKFVGLQNYKDIFLKREGLTVLKNTFLYAVLVVLMEIPLGITVALLLNQETRFIRGVRAIIILPLLMPPIVAAIMWKVMMHTETGVLNFVLGKVGIPAFSWLTLPQTALVSVVLIDVWIFTPFVVIIILAGLQAISMDVIEASRIDGASSLQVFWHMILPYLLPYIILTIIFRAVDSLNMFDIIYGTTKGGPIISTMLMHVAAYIKVIRGGDMRYGMTYTTTLWIFCFIFVQFLTIAMKKIHAGLYS